MGMRVFNCLYCFVWCRCFALALRHMQTLAAQPLEGQLHDFEVGSKEIYSLMPLNIVNSLMNADLYSASFFPDTEGRLPCACR